MTDFNKFVEGYLTGIKVNQTEKSAELFLQEVTGRSWVLTATDVSELMILELRMQNIIDRIVIWDASSSDVDYRSKLFCLIHGKSAEEKDVLNSSLINQAIETIQHGSAVLVELEPVYGALVLMLTRKVSLTEGQRGRAQSLLRRMF